MTTEPVHGHLRVVDPGYGLADLANDLWAVLTLLGLLTWAYVVLRLAAHA